MTGFLQRARVASLAGAAAAILIVGIAAGAAGDFMVIGESNNSGASQTILLTTAGGASFTLRNTTAGQTGQFGWSSGATGPGRGVYGRADSPAGYGLYAYNSAATSGGGRGLLAVAETNTAIEGLALDCTGVFLCGSNGVQGTGAGFAAGVFGDGTDSVAGIWGAAGEVGWAVVGFSAVTDAPAILGSNSDGTGVVGEGASSGGTGSCTDLACFGVAGDGYNGTGGWSQGDFGFGLYGTAAAGFGLWVDGAAVIDGSLSVDSCTGCASAAIAQNGGKSTIKQGDALTLKNVSTMADGTVVLVVDLAKGNDAVIGIADIAMTVAPDTVTVDASTRTIKTKYGEKTVTTPARTIPNQTAGGLMPGGTSAAAGAYLRVVTGGVFAFEAAAPDAAAGDVLAVGSTPGKLGKAPADVAKGVAAGKYLGSTKDGRVVLLVGAN